MILLSCIIVGGNNMHDNESKIKFYSLGSEKIDFSNISNWEPLDSSKPVIASKGFNKALKSVIDKDIALLSKKISDIVKEIKKTLVINNFTNENISDKVEDIDEIVNEVETTISRIIIEKESIKLKLFSTNKKLKKERLKNLSDAIDTLSKYQAELISISNEYNKLTQRKMFLKDDSFDNENSKKKKEDPLERTVNFYMNKQKEI